MVRIFEAAYGITLVCLVLSTAMLIAVLIWNDINAASSALELTRL